MSDPLRTSKKSSRFTESVIREMTRVATKHGAINLAQGFPNFSAPQFIKDAACRAIQDDINQYAVTWGSPDLRLAIASKYQKQYDWKIDPDSEVTVCCGATECMIASMLALVDAGDRVLVFEPFYENYGPDAVIAGALPVYVPLHAESNWTLDLDEVETAILKHEGIRALILNTPNNPTGKVFSSAELSGIAELANRHDFIVITDEIYEHILYDGASHRPLALFPGMKERTVTISGLSKTFSVTGWRIGYVVAPAQLSVSVRKMHDFLTVGAAAPLQQAAAHALVTDSDYYQTLSEEYLVRRDYFLPRLEQAGFKIWRPAGAYYVMADFSGISSLPDDQFTMKLIQEAGVAAVPGSSFFHQPELGRQLIRFAFCKTLDMLSEAADRLDRWRLGAKTP